MLEWLRGGEPARSRVAEVLASERPLMSWINLGEVAYVLQRRAGERRAREVVATLRGALSLELPSAERVLEAAAIKAAHAVSYADAFAVATSLKHDAVLLTGDLEILAANPAWKIEDLRP